MIPPSTERVWPVMNLELSLAAKAITGRKSLIGSPISPPMQSCAIDASCAANCSGVIIALICSYIGVLMQGAIMFTRMLYFIQSFARVLVQAVTAPLDAP